MRSAPLLLLILFLVNSAVTAAALTVSDVEKDVMCVCGCGKVLENCLCGTADRMRGEIAGMIAKGMSKKEIIAELQSMYGKEVLVNPPKEGVFLGLWTYPVIAVAIGIVAIYIIGRRRNAKWYADPDEVINEEFEETFDETKFDLEHD